MNKEEFVVRVVVLKFFLSVGSGHIPTREEGLKWIREAEKLFKEIKRKKV